MRVGVPCFSCGGPSESIILEPQKDVRTEVAMRMSHLTKIPYQHDRRRDRAPGEDPLRLRHGLAGLPPEADLPAQEVDSAASRERGSSMTRTLTIDPVTRIEGHARVEVEHRRRRPRLRLRASR